ncbi:uncharacterized protein F5Z01DRAFT_735665 [Emericellopsis atlantica]|uniref:Uncharacterized protein n=1 Tax=Emericellopsis atlantica TaxID=2614577 RepID=A0A9P8CQX5_9HYPO|nr:uncharacterized protein F5Z01DRAFT_735665 [Emericellopsis atlantica]KAG9255732.1 hypothetical protein F5Z01DRAFT_735665 [Emericellopsis atlantica]
MGRRSPCDKVYIIMCTSPDGPLTTSVLSVFAALQDANEECLRQARAAGVELTRESSTSGPETDTIGPVEPVRWDTLDGVSCWVEAFDVIPQRIQPSVLQ